MKIIFISLSSVLCCFHLFGQSIEPAGFITSANYYSSPTSVSLHSSFGEIVTERISEDEDISLTQGFLQTFFQLVPTENIESSKIQITVGPNPCITEFSIEKYTDDQFTVYLMDLNGQVVHSSNLVDRKTTIDLSNQPSASYFLSIQHDNKQVFHTYKIIKS